MIYKLTITVRLVAACIVLGWTALPAAAQVGLPGQKAGAPVEITADNLMVRQQENLAIFSGNVEAVQGKMNLRADELRVHYENGSDAGGQAIQRIEAEGNVVVVSEDQTASGTSGTYEPAANRVTLDGNVVLSTAENVIRGGHLDFDLATGVATLSAAAGEGGKPGRVRALFRPEAGGPASGG